MRKLVIGLVGAGALAMASGANAAVTIVTPNTVVSPTPGQFATFFVSGNIFSGPITATFGDTGIPGGTFADSFQFTIPQTGTGSGSLTTSVTAANFLGVTDTDILSVVVNGLAANLTLEDANGNVCPTRGVGTCGANETWSLNNVPITFGVLNSIDVTGLSRGNGSYGGNATFIPAVPEPATWAMLLVGFGAIGFSMRRRRALALPQMA